MKFTQEELHAIWHKVPVDYYQKGVKNNILQRLWHRGKLVAVASLVNENTKKILDVGCASGWFLHMLSKKFPNAKCVGIDSYKDAIMYGKKKYKNLTLVDADGHKIPFSDESFDLVICTEMLEHVLDPNKVIQEIKRVLKPDGLAVIEMDSGNMLFRLIWYWWTNMRNGVWKDSHIQPFTASKLEGIIKKGGLKIKKKKNFNFTMAVAFQIKK